MTKKTKALMEALSCYCIVDGLYRTTCAALVSEYCCCFRVGSTVVAGWPSMNSRLRAQAVNVCPAVYINLSTLDQIGTLT